MNDVSGNGLSRAQKTYCQVEKKEKEKIFVETSRLEHKLNDWDVFLFEVMNQRLERDLFNQ